jgi:phosphogluconate dehydratase
VFKSSSVNSALWAVRAPARVFDSQEDVLAAFGRDELNQDAVIVVRFQGPRANGMPELHKLTPPLGVLLDRGFKIALVTDGRMSGASGKVPCAIHVHPEALGGGPLSRVRDGDLIQIDAENGLLSIEIDPSIWEARTPDGPKLGAAGPGLGRELFAAFRDVCGDAETGASAILDRMNT